MCDTITAGANGKDGPTMKLGDDQGQVLSDVGEAILAALTTVSQAAQQALFEPHAGIPTRHRRASRSTPPSTKPETY